MKGMTPDAQPGVIRIGVDRHGLLRLSPLPNLKTLSSALQPFSNRERCATPVGGAHGGYGRREKHLLDLCSAEGPIRPKRPKETAEDGRR
jgi:hypothetical protein